MHNNVQAAQDLAAASGPVAGGMAMAKRFGADTNYRRRGEQHVRIVTRESYVRSVPIFLVAVGNLPIPAPTTSSATVTYTSATVPVMRV